MGELIQLYRRKKVARVREAPWKYLRGTAEEVTINLITGWQQLSLFT